MSRGWLLAGLGLPVSAPFLWWLAEAPAQAQQQDCLVSCDSDQGQGGSDKDDSGRPLWQGPPLAVLPVPVRDIRIDSVEPVRPAPDPDPEDEPKPRRVVVRRQPAPEDEDAAEQDGGAAPDDEDDGPDSPSDPIRPRVADDIVGGVGDGARRLDADWRMQGADLGVPVDLGLNYKGEQVLGYIFGDATSKIQPFTHGGPDLDLVDGVTTWANPMLYTHIDQFGNEVADGFADEDDVPAYPAWSTRWVGDSLQAAGTDPEPPPLPPRGLKGLPLDLVGRDSAAGTPGGSMLQVVRSLGGRAEGLPAASIVPTSAVVIDDKLYVAFQVANNWDVSAQWTTLQSQIVQFDIDPDTRRAVLPIPELPAPALVLANPWGQRPRSKPKDWRRGAPFQQMEFAMVDPPDGSPPLVYIGGQQEGRANDGFHMARSAPEDLMDPDRWEYYTAKGWYRPRPGTPLDSLPVTPPLPTVLRKKHASQDGVGESGLMQVGHYLALVYTRNMETPIAMRLAPLDRPTEFGPELAVVTGDGRDGSLRDPRGVYGGFLSSAQSDGGSLVATVSHWGGYGTYQVRINLDQPLD